MIARVGLRLLMMVALLVAGLGLAQSHHGGCDDPSLLVADAAFDLTQHSDPHPGHNRPCGLDDGRASSCCTLACALALPTATTSVPIETGERPWSQPSRPAPTVIVPVPTPPPRLT